MKMKSLISGGVAALASMLLLLGGAGPASAQETAPDSSAVVESCWGDIATGNTACAATDEELAVKIYEQFGVVIAGEAPADLKLSDQQRSSSAAKSSASVQAAYLLGVWYDGANYTGSSWTHTTTATSNPCPSPQNYLYGEIGNLGAFAPLTDWNNRISSFQGYNHCGFQLFNGYNFTGSAYGPVLNAPNLGAFDNLAKSLRMRYV